MGGSGGGSSGAVDYPKGMKTMQSRLLVGLEQADTLDWTGLGISIPEMIQLQITEQDTDWDGYSPSNIADDINFARENNPFRASDRSYREMIITGYCETPGGTAELLEIILADSSSPDDDTYNDMLIEIDGGFGIGQTRTISDYDGSTRTATLSAVWAEEPVGNIESQRAANDSHYIIYQDSIDLGNPNATAYDPAPEITAMLSRLTVFTDAVDAIDPTTQWEGYATAADTKASELVSPLSIETSVQEQVDNALSDSVAAVDSVISADVVPTAIVDTVVAKVTEILAPLMRLEPGEAQSVIAPIVAEGLTTNLAALDTTAIQSAAGAKRDQEGLVAFGSSEVSALDGVIDGAVTRATASLSTLSSDAVTIALAALGEDALDAAVAAMEVRERPDLNRNLARFRAGMGKIGGMMTSASLNGYALLINRHQDRVSEFRGNLTLESYKEVLSQYLRRHAAQTELETRAKVQLVVQAVEQIAQNVATQYSLYQGLFSNEQDAIGRQISEQYRFQLSNISQLQAQSVAHQDSISTQKIQSFNNLAPARISSFLRNYLQDRGLRGRILQSGISEQSQFWSIEMQTQMQAAHFTAEINRLAIAGYASEQESNLEIDHRESTFNLDMYDYAGRMMAAISGAATPNTTGRSPNKTAGVAGGAVSGAVAGAQIGSVGGPVGTVIGAVVGAVAGGIAGSQ